MTSHWDLARHVTNQEAVLMNLQREITNLKAAVEALQKKVSAIEEKNVVLSSKASDNPMGLKPYDPHSF